MGSFRPEWLSVSTNALVLQRCGVSPDADQQGLALEGAEYHTKKSGLTIAGTPTH
jgi:hypothetical protein